MADSCCPKIFWPYGVGSSASAYHEPSNTYIGSGGHDLETGSVVYNLLGTGIGVYPDFYAPSIIRTHNGTHWYLVTSSSPWYDAPRGPQITGVTDLALRQEGPTGNASEVKQYELMQEFGEPTAQRFDEGDPEYYEYFNEIRPSGADWSPIEDCMYALVNRQTSNGQKVYASEPKPTRNLNLMRITFDGSYTIAATIAINDGSTLVPGGSVSVGSDGAVWCLVNTTDGFARVYRKPYGAGGLTPITLNPPIDPYKVLGTIGGATPWGALMIFAQYAAGPAWYETLNRAYIVLPDGTTKRFECPYLETPGFFAVAGTMRSENFQRLFLSTATAGLAEIEWKKCGSGWVVGGMTIG